MKSRSQKRKERKEEKQKKRLHKKLIKASEKGNLKKVKDILKEEPQIIDRQTNKGENTAMTKAAKNGHLAIVKFLDQNNANKSIKNAKGETACERAGKMNKPAVKTYLEEREKPTFSNRLLNMKASLQRRKNNLQISKVAHNLANLVVANSDRIEQGLIALNNAVEEQVNNNVMRAQAGNRNAPPLLANQVFSYSNYNEQNFADSDLDSDSENSEYSDSEYSDDVSDLSQEQNSIRHTHSNNNRNRLFSNRNTLQNESRNNSTEDNPLEKKLTDNGCNPDDLPAFCKCPLGLEIMVEPVMCKESGQTYEKAWLKNYLGNSNSKVDPVNPAKKVYRSDLQNINYSIKGAIDYHIESLIKSKKEKNISASIVMNNTNTNNSNNHQTRERDVAALQTRNTTTTTTTTSTSSATNATNATNAVKMTSTVANKTITTNNNTNNRPRRR